MKLIDCVRTYRNIDLTVSYKMNFQCVSELFHAHVRLLISYSCERIVFHSYVSHNGE
jgi:hypothetical protein